MLIGTHEDDDGIIQQVTLTLHPVWRDVGWPAPCSEGLLLGARQLKFLASSYAGILAVFISGCARLRFSSKGRLGSAWPFVLIRVAAW
eukprot:6196055-Pleurochrysis_carterae.AAC.1